MPDRQISPAELLVEGAKLGRQDIFEYPAPPGGLLLSRVLFYTPLAAAANWSEQGQRRREPWPGALPMWASSERGPATGGFVVRPSGPADRTGRSQAARKPRRSTRFFRRRESTGGPGGRESSLRRSSSFENCFPWGALLENGAVVFVKNCVYKQTRIRLAPTNGNRVCGWEGGIPFWSAKSRPRTRGSLTRSARSDTPNGGNIWIATALGERVGKDGFFILKRCCGVRTPTQKRPGRVEVSGTMRLSSVAQRIQMAQFDQRLRRFLA